MAPGVSGFRVLVPLLLLFFISTSSLASEFSSGSWMPSYSYSTRDLLGYLPKKGRNSNNEAIPNCREMASRTGCVNSSKWCRWCRSVALDDMCFGLSEAWRLPQQVFSCE